MEENFDVMQGLSNNVSNQSEDQSILALETEAITQADNEGIDVALKWLQHRAFLIDLIIHDPTVWSLLVCSVKLKER